uniref:Uncharacterized protein n=1 Tax=Lepeophtheirus salmonis TaxID=72036 RepID=A0A0K2V4B5_LEPSM
MCIKIYFIGLFMNLTHKCAKKKVCEGVIFLLILLLIFLKAIQPLHSIAVFLFCS